MQLNQAVPTPFKSCNSFVVDCFAVDCEIMLAFLSALLSGLAKSSHVCSVVCKCNDCTQLYSFRRLPCLGCVCCLVFAHLVFASMCIGRGPASSEVRPATWSVNVASDRTHATNTSREGQYVVMLCNWGEPSVDDGPLDVNTEILICSSIWLPPVVSHFAMRPSHATRASSEETGHTGNSPSCKIRSIMFCKRELASGSHLWTSRPQALTVSFNGYRTTLRCAPACHGELAVRLSAVSAIPSTRAESPLVRLRYARAAINWFSHSS